MSDQRVRYVHDGAGWIRHPDDGDSAAEPGSMEDGLLATAEIKWGEGMPRTFEAFPWLGECWPVRTGAQPPLASTTDTTEEKGGGIIADESCQLWPPVEDPDR